MIVIRWDYSLGDEISYIEGLAKKDDFFTHCLDFFSNDIEANVIVLREDGFYIKKSSIQDHTDKEIRKEHNLHKMLLANAFTFKKLENENLQ